MRQRGESRRAEFEESALPHLHALHGVALKLTRRPEEAEDLVQETLLRAYRFFHQYEAGTNIKAWLFRIMRNLVINRYRKRQREPETVDIGGVEATLEALMKPSRSAEAGSATPEQILVDGSVDEEIEKALAALPDEYRMVLLLAAMEGLSYREIAGVLEIPIGTVMSRLHRARRMMQSKLVDYARQKGFVDPGPGRGTDVVDIRTYRGTGGE